MFGQQFYHQTIRKYVALFGTLFNDIHIARTNKANQITQYIKVPITYAAKEKMLARLQQDPNIDRPSATITMPVMSFEMTSISYDTDRKLNTITRSAFKDTTNGTNKLRYQYNPVPYNIGFRLYIMVKNAEDGTKIVEQILPYFTPDFTTTIMLIPEINEKKDIPVILNDISQEDQYEGNFTERRQLIWTLDFTLKGYIYGPVKKSAIIKYANNVFYTPSIENLQDAVGQVDPVSYVQVQPGLTVSGQPTSNAAASIPVGEIEVTDDFGYVIEKTDLVT
jgi:hypothetical protein